MTREDAEKKIETWVKARINGGEINAPDIATEGAEFFIKRQDLVEALLFKSLRDLILRRIHTTLNQRREATREEARGKREEDFRVRMPEGSDPEVKWGDWAGRYEYVPGVGHVAFLDLTQVLGAKVVRHKRLDIESRIAETDFIEEVTQRLEGDSTVKDTYTPEELNETYNPYLQRVRL